MATDMDIDIDLDMGLEEDLGMPGMEHSALQQPEPILSTPNDTSDANASDSVPNKVHLRGLDNLTTADIRAFSIEYLPSHKPVHVEWIDDTSANIIYENADIARDALVSFSAVPISDITLIAPLQTIAAKSFPLHPDTNLQVRLAVLGDRKQAGARERSRFYLFNPEYDPQERRKRGGYRGDRADRGSNRYRDREDGGYRSQRYDNREQQKRERDSGFDVNLYDDDAGALAKRITRNDSRPDSSSGSDSRGRGDSRHVRFQRSAGRELFPERVGAGGGRLRNRSASPLRDTDGDRDMGEGRVSERRGEKVAVEENRQKAQLIKARLREASIKKELFPQKISTDHARSGIYDVADETADLFATKISIPLTDEGTDSFPRNGGFNIRGAAKASVNQPQTFSIKGAAGPRVKELFPSKFGENAGKELFSEKLEGRKGTRRQKAEDLFQ